MNNTIFYGFLFAILAISNSVFVVNGSIDVNENNIIQLINDLDNEKSLYLFGGLTINKVDKYGVNGRSMKPLSSSDKYTTESLLDRTERYFKTHEINFSFNDAADSESSQFNGRSATEESRSRKLKKVLIPFLLALKVKLALVMKFLLMAVKFISLKALATAVLALVLSGANFFKDLLAKKQEHVTTAYITGNPLNADIIHSDGWNRNGQAAAQEMAYNYHQPAY